MTDDETLWSEVNNLIHVTTTRGWIREISICINRIRVTLLISNLDIDLKFLRYMYMEKCMIWVFFRLQNESHLPFFSSVVVNPEVE